MQVIDECMQAYKLGFKSFNNGKAMPNGFSKHQQECFKMGFGDAKNNKQYPSTKNQELSVETQINAYSEGCYVEQPKTNPNWLVYFWLDVLSDWLCKCANLPRSESDVLSC